MISIVIWDDFYVTRDKLSRPTQGLNQDIKGPNLGTKESNLGTKRPSLGTKGPHLGNLGTQFCIARKNERGHRSNYE